MRAELGGEHPLPLGSHNLLEGHTELVFALLLTGLGVALRVFQLGTQSLLDELFSIEVARCTGPGIAFKLTRGFR